MSKQLVTLLTTRTQAVQQLNTAIKHQLECSASDFIDSDTLDAAKSSYIEQISNVRVIDEAIDHIKASTQNAQALEQCIANLKTQLKLSTELVESKDAELQALMPDPELLVSWSEFDPAGEVPVITNPQSGLISNLESDIQKKYEEIDYLVEVLKSTETTFEDSSKAFEARVVSDNDKIAKLKSQINSFEDSAHGCISLLNVLSNALSNMECTSEHSEMSAEDAREALKNVSAMLLNAVAGGAE